MSFASWLLQERQRLVLLEVDYQDNGITRTRYLSNGAFVSKPTDVPANQPYDPYITGGVEFERSLSEVFTGVSVSKVSDIQVLLTEQTMDLVDLQVFGRGVRVYFGDPSWTKAQFVQVIAGVCDGILPEQTTFKIKFRDAADRLQNPLLTERIATGPSSGQLKPLCLGRCFNIKPVLLDDATHTYLFNCTASQAVTAVRFNGALVPSNYYSVNLQSSTITFSVYPQGDVTLDVDGTVSGSWLVDAASMITWMAGRLSLSVDVQGLPTYMLGLYVTTDQTVYSLLDEICASVGAYWFFDRTGLFMVRAFTGLGAPVDVISRDQTVAQSRRLRKVIQPLYQLTAQYKRNWTPLVSIAGSVHEATPALAQELASQGKSLTASQAIIAQYPQAIAITIETLLVTSADVTTEVARRLALSSVPRYVYELKCLASAFSWFVGMTVGLEQAGKNGVNAVLTKLVESPISGSCNVEFWQ